MSIFSELFSRVEEKSDLVLVFDVGSSSVGGALFVSEPSGTPKIIMSVREPIPLEADVGFDRFLSLATKSIHNVAHRIFSARLGAPHRIVCVLSSPWYVSQNRIISLSQEEPFNFTTKLADSLIKKEISLFEEEYLKKYTDAGSTARLIEFKNIKTTLNGYEAVKPLNQKARDLEISIFISVAGEEILKNIENTISKTFHIKNIKFCSFGMVSFSVVRDLFSEQEDFLLIDLGGEVADISMVKKNVMKEAVSFPMGTNFIVRGISGALDCTLEEAKSLFSLYKDGHAVGATRKKLEPVMNDLKTKWLQSFQKSLANLSNDISIPPKIFIAIDKEFYDFFLEIIKTEQFNQYTLTESKFEVTFLDAMTLNGVASFKDNAERDPFIILEAIYINRFFH
jgi:hypothetical protein